MLDSDPMPVILYAKTPLLHGRETTAQDAKVISGIRWSCGFQAGAQRWLGIMGKIKGWRIHVFIPINGLEDLLVKE